MRPIPISNHLIIAYLDDMQRQGRSRSSIRSYRHNLGLFERWLDGRDPVALNKNDIRDYVDTLRGRGLTARTVRHYLTTLSSFYEFLVYEERIETNPVITVQKRYTGGGYKIDGEAHTHKLISVEEAARLLDCLVDIRDKCIVLLMLKTGIRRNELISLDVSDVSMQDRSILLKPTGKRSNRVVFFDDETARILQRWLLVRAERANGRQALFPGTWLKKARIGECVINGICVRGALRAGLHNPESPNMEDHFSPHCCRHWFTTHLRRSGMPREFIQELRGDVRREAIDIYDHIDKKELRESYIAHIPQLGI